MPRDKQARPQTPVSTCGPCQKSFPTFEDLLRHIADKHHGSYAPAAAEPAPERTQMETGWKPSEYQRGLDEASKLIYQAAKREGFVLNPQRSDMGLSQEVNALIRCAKESVPEPARCQNCNQGKLQQHCTACGNGIPSYDELKAHWESENAEPAAQQESEIWKWVEHWQDCGINKAGSICTCGLNEFRARQAEPAPTPSRPNIETYIARIMQKIKAYKLMGNYVVALEEIELVCDRFYKDAAEASALGTKEADEKV